MSGDSAVQDVPETLAPERILESVRTFLQAFHIEDDIRSIDLETDLVNSGLVDSFSVIELLIHIEELSGVPVDFDRIKLSSVRTVKALYETFFGRVA